MASVTPDEIGRIGNAFDAIVAAVRDFGSALGADDRFPGAGAGAPLEKAGNAAIRAAFDRTPELAAILPRLYAEVTSGADLADSGYAIMDEVRAASTRLGLPLHGDWRS